MSASIIKLPTAKRGRVRCVETGVVFPQLYRLTGRCWKLKEGRELKDGFIQNNDDLEPGEEIEPSYTLDSERSYAQIADPRWEPIKTLDPGVDKGWIIIRHHQSRGDVETYLDAMYDTETYDEFGEERFMAFETDFGSFTILHRLANRGAQDCVVIYKTKVEDQLTGRGAMMDWHKVIGPDGKELDIDDLDPPEIQQGFTPIKNLAKAMQERSE